MVHEASGHAGGRCRSYFDATLGMDIDNGNHLVLSGNSATMAYLGRIGSASELTGPARSEFAFADLATGERWKLALNDGALPWWVLSPSRRVPHTKPADYLAVARLLNAGSHGNDRRAARRQRPALCAIVAAASSRRAQHRS